MPFSPQQPAAYQLFHDLKGLHVQRRIVLFEPIENRAFGDWHMAFAGLELRTSIEIDGILKSPAAINTDQKGGDVVDFLLGKVVNRIRLNNK